MEHLKKWLLKEIVNITHFVIENRTVDFTNRNAWSRRHLAIFMLFSVLHILFLFSLRVFLQHPVEYDPVMVFPLLWKGRGCFVVKYIVVLVLAKIHLLPRFL